ncbi:MAG: anthranilate synthase component II [Hyphococcus sp.]
MILLIDNYDSFTYNLAHLIGGLGVDVEVRRNDAVDGESAVSFGADAIVISPGPGRPEDAGACLDIIKKAAGQGVPVFGVCLGMQAIADAFGGAIVQASRLMHGKTCAVTHAAKGIFQGLPSPFTATRYHSLAVDAATFPDDLEATAHAEDDQEIMALEHRRLPIAGVQFHPESIASEHGGALIANFLKATRA